MLSELLKDEMKQRGISIREAARQIGIAHTTVSRIIKGNQVDLDTVELVSHWLSIDVSNALNGLPEETRVVPLLTSLLDRNPKLKKYLSMAVAELDAGKIEVQDLEDILAYITFRLEISHKNKVSDA